MVKKSMVSRHTSMPLAHPVSLWYPLKYIGQAPGRVERQAGERFALDADTPGSAIALLEEVIDELETLTHPDD
jgi:hypothetical protein